MTIENSVYNLFCSTFVDSMNVFDCCLSGGDKMRGWTGAGGGGTGIEGADSGVEGAELGVEGAGSGSRGGGKRGNCGRGPGKIGGRNCFFLLENS